LQAKFESKGLSIIGVTDEAPDKTEPWIEKKGAKHPYAYDWSGELTGHFGVRSIPHSVLVDANGKVAFRGHPSEITEDKIAKLLGDVWPSDVRGPLKKSEYAKALTAARKFEGKPFAARIQKAVDRRVGLLEELWKEADYFALESEGAQYRTAFAGLDAGKTVVALLDKLKTDEKAQGGLAAQKRIRDLVENGMEELGIEGIRKALLEIKEKHPDTAAYREADYILGQLPE